ncbi:MAG: hypothetical protein HYZ53_19465, partial [Planctomycetes bacterium]|nr:hypothetical protein [Planctomycetota bacterium]
MESLLREIAALPSLADVERALDAGSRCELGGLWGSSPTLLAAAFALRRNATVLLVLPSVEDADEAADDLAAALGDRFRHFPAWETLPSETAPADPRIFADRLQLLLELSTAAPAATGPRVVTTPALALVQPVPPPGRVSGRTLTLTVGEDVDREDLVRTLVESEMERSPAVDMPGEFSVRGGIFDLFPSTSPRPIRLEFFGDTIESIRSFDPGTQSSDQSFRTVTLSLVRKSDFRGARQPVAGEASAAVPAQGCDVSTSAGATASLLEHLPAGTVLFLKEPGEALDRLGRLLASEGAAEPQETTAALHRGFGRFPRVEVHALPVGEGPAGVNLRTVSTQRFSGDLGNIFAELRTLVSESRRVVVLCANEAEEERLHDLLKEEGLGTERRLEVLLGRLARGFQLPDLGLVLLPHQELFNRYRLRRAARQVKDSRPIDTFL